MKFLKVSICAGLLMSLLCGCTSWSNASYQSIQPHSVDDAHLPKESVEVSNYSQLESALRDFVEDCGTSAVFYTKWIGENSDELMRGAIASVKARSPIGAYAVDQIRYEIGTNSGKTAIAVEVSYLYDRSELLRIKRTTNMQAAKNLIYNSLDACDSGAVIRVANYEDTDLIQLVQDYVDTHPNTCMEMPQVSAAAYPEQGSDRILVLKYTYQTSRESLRSMQQTVEQVFSSAQLYVSSDAENWEKYEQLYSFLMERYNYTIETSITPSYSLLRHGVGDSKAFATVYAAMCRQVGLECYVVSGSRNGEPRYWNILLEDGVYYHVDLLQCSVSGAFKAKQDQQMQGYVWDYSAFTHEESSNAS